MLRKVLVISLLLYFVCGTLLLPQGDFSALADLPRMYQHCKETEDPDMDLPDFIVEHLLQIDDDMGEPDSGDHEKPHQPIQFNHISSPTTTVVRQYAIKMQPLIPIEKVRTLVNDENYLSDYPSSVFRPPIVIG